MKESKAQRRFEKLNKHGAPTKLLLAQAVIVTIISLFYLLLPSVNAVYWLFTALASQIYMVMYVLMFVAAIILRKKKVERKRGFMIPGGIPGLCVVAVLGLIGSIFTFFIGFFPPSDVGIVSPMRYELLIWLGLILMAVVPWIWIARKKVG